MAKILVIGGTSEGKRFVAEMPAGHQVTFSFYSQLGADMILSHDIEKRVGPLDRSQMAALLKSEGYDFLVDVSHPYAAEVSANAKAAAADAKVPYLRYRRPPYPTSYEKTVLFAGYEEAAAYLQKTEGNVFFAIGSKNIRRFLPLPRFRERCYFRVLAASNVLKEVEDLGLAPGQIFAMQGIATAELNIALLRMVNAAFLVTKDSGVEGGMREKEEAAMYLGIPLLMIGRPAEDGSLDFPEIWRRIEDGKNA